MPVSERRSTMPQYPLRQVHTYFGDESDEGLVNKDTSLCRASTIITMSYCYF